ncbi:superoxide dismutase family protein [Rhodococcus sp. D2-41]|uniref:Superoxide dismutase [Cu-Zn] n=1 Tax=Speluncibacter jeojiensis TaxID=2710754 RepID=A0A9X4M6R6_9ACTN|nr:superoxide dismutase family protein [Rhodococcus sp. D2-41]MDG3010033.1 superoxide dismutase family protein [Rhodococcus sp. D2-41]MDG3016263.1 superoxide dismutase family protein [Corynebacteriales bacterium D3-21]
MTQRSLQHRSRRGSRWLAAVPMVAIAALGLTACSNGETATNEPNSTSVPAVWSAAPQPGKVDNGAQPGAGAQGDAAGAGLTADLVNPAGSKVGTATFSQVGDAVQIRVTAEGLAPGFHGLHIHSVGKCEPHSQDPSDPSKIGDFLSAGPHFTNSSAETDNVMASGDLTSLQVGADGKATLVTTTTAFTLGELTAGKGTALVVHAGPDNFGNIPARYTQAGGATGPDKETAATGDAGARVACGVITAG